MDKQTLSNYGWIVICVLVLAVMLALATPFGSFVQQGVQSAAQGLFDTNNNALDAAGIATRPPIGEVDENTYVVALNRTFNAAPGMTLYEAISEQWKDLTDRGVNEYTVWDMDISEIFVDENGKIMNLKKTYIEQGRTYESVYYNRTVGVTEDDILKGIHQTVYVDVQNIFGTEDRTFLPIFTKYNGTALNVIHSLYPAWYFLAAPEDAQGAQQEHIMNYVVGYPSGQEIGCGTSTSHAFFALVDMSGNLVPLNTMVNNLNKYTAIVFAVSENDATFEEAKAQMMVELNKYLDDISYGAYTTDCQIKLDTPYTFEINGVNVEYIFFKDGSIVAIASQNGEESGEVGPAKTVRYFKDYILLDGVRYNISADGNTLTDPKDSNFVATAGTKITSAPITRNVKYTCEYNGYVTSIVVKSNGGMELYENGVLTGTATPTEVTIYDNYIYVNSYDIYIGIYPDGTKVIANNMVFVQE